MPPLQTARSRLFAPLSGGDGTIACSVEAIPLSRELEGKNQAETQVVVAVLRRVPVPIRGAAIRLVVEVAAAAIHPVDALRRLTTDL